MKAANIWAHLTGMRFLANGILPNFDTEADVQAQELYLEYTESFSRGTGPAFGAGALKFSACSAQSMRIKPNSPLVQ